MGGHVFVTRGDLTRLDCDAFLLPSDGACYVAKGWHTHLPELAEHVPALDLPEGWGHDGVRTAPFDASIGGPQPWLTNVGGWEGIEVEWYLEGARQFVHQASAALAEREPRHGRARHLLALPVVGTGYGGAHELSGDMLMELLALLHELAAGIDHDLVLVTKGHAHFAAAQRARQRAIDERLDGHLERWWALEPRLLAAGRATAEHARDGRLVLFVGAGISRGAGLPGWNELLERLEAQVGFASEQRVLLDELDALDRARLIELNLGEDSRPLGELVVAETSAFRYSVAHSLLAGLPVNEIVTTNYDDLFERAAEDAGDPAAVLPYEPSAGASRWLLKLHGSIDHPEDIVLTRADYLRYEDRRAALEGIVQALLITRHMLFVGFSFHDDNFHRIVDDVRKAVRGPNPASAVKFGTAVHLVDQPLMHQLWDADLTTVGMRNEPGDEAAAARDLDIFLDLVLAQASDARSHLLDDHFMAALTPEEKDVRASLRRLRDETPAAAKQSKAWEPIARLLREYGDE